jgi:hypothetical protein
MEGLRVIKYIDMNNYILGKTIVLIYTCCMYKYGFVKDIDFKLNTL